MLELRKPDGGDAQQREARDRETRERLVGMIRAHGAKALTLAPDPPSQAAAAAAGGGMRTHDGDDDHNNQDEDDEAQQGRKPPAATGEDQTITRFTKLQPWGMLGRDEVLADIISTLEQFRQPSKENQPWISIVSMSREGKTLTTDEVAHSLAAVRAISGGKDVAEARVFSITFNACFSVDTIRTTVGRPGQPAYLELQPALNELWLRIVTAATGRHKPFGTVTSALAAWCALRKVSADDILQLLHDGGALLHGAPLLLCIDELTKLTDLISASDALTFMSQLATFISGNRAVIFNGFTRVNTHLSVSDRKVRNVELVPITSAVKRRQLLVMKTVFLFNFS